MLCFHDTRRLSSEGLSERLFADEFEKDDDANCHVDFIYGMTNLRCKCYGLKEMPWIEVKGKAGKIIPALVTTTAAVAGLQCIELVKVLSGAKFEAYRNSFMNLAVPSFSQSDPGLPPKTELAEGVTVTLWDRWEVKQGDLTLVALREFLKERYGGIEVEDFNLGAKFLYSAKLDAGSPAGEAKMQTRISKLSRAKKSQGFVDLRGVFTKAGEKKESCSTPVIRIYPWIDESEKSKLATTSSLLDEDDIALLDEQSDGESDYSDEEEDEEEDEEDYGSDNNQDDY